MSDVLFCSWYVYTLSSGCRWLNVYKFTAVQCLSVYVYLVTVTNHMPVSDEPECISMDHQGWWPADVAPSR